jgi:hypothetical protein
MGSILGKYERSYQMIHEFQKLNIEVRAIEQPLDLNVPESIHVKRRHKHYVLLYPPFANMKFKDV